MTLDKKNYRLLNEKRLYCLRKNLEEIKMLFNILEEKLTESFQLSQYLINNTNEEV